MSERRLWTVALLLLAWAFYARWQQSVRLGYSQEIGPASNHEEGKRVTIDPTGLRYYEGNNRLRLTVEMANGRRVDYIVYVWTADAWIREMPEWCRYRRNEVLQDIKRLTADRRIEWVEVD